MDKCTCQTCVGDQRNIQVDGGATDLVTVADLAFGEVLRNVHHHVNLFLVQHIQCLRMSLLVRPVYQCIFNTVFCEEAAGSSGSIQVVTVLLQLAGRIEHACLLLGTSGREQDVLLRNTVAH